MLSAFKLFIPSLLLLTFPQHLCSQEQALAATSELDQLAYKLADHLPVQHPQIVVMDFSTPDKRSLPFGAYLADEFSAALTKHGGPFGIVDRKRLSAALDSLRFQPEKEFDFQTSLKLAKLIGADCIVRGSYGEFDGGLGVTVTAAPLREMASPGESYLVNGKLSLSPEMASHLGEPLESLRTKGVPDSGTAGMTLVKCIRCPEATYSDAAVKAKLQGTVELTVTVTPEGRVRNIAVRKALGKGLDENAISAVRDWTFAPALDPDGKPVAVRQTIECTFHLYKR